MIVKYVAQAKEIIDIEIAALHKVRDQLDGQFDQAVDLILEHVGRGGKVVVTGLGKSLHIGHKLVGTLRSTGTPSVLLHPSEAMHGDLGIFQPGDVLLSISYSGESEELIELLPIVKRNGVSIIALTGEPKSTLARYSDVVLLARVDREACPFNMAPTASTTAALAICDALAMVLLEARGFKKEDYAKLHPGGAIGRTLLLRVEDIMRTGDHLAKVGQEATVKDAVLAMTSARAGSVAVVDEKDLVLGIFTDGDLRRHITNAASLPGMKVTDVMTADPISLTKDHLAVDVLALYEKHNIDDLVIVDHEGRLMGMVDIQDLPKLKIF
ncbi:MAG TPA: KpsF/GutQ family sugar-phosphate isomerase [Verrucomicrobia bacterium]|nr:KpsF/GutQ family sugar-phosphate isomerase [Verrucomicrobiota bacterium]